MKTIHLLSGGLDSVTMLYDMVGNGADVHCLLCDYKQQHLQELTFARYHAHRMGVPFTTVEIPRLGGLTENDWKVPNRNAILISIAVNLAITQEAEIITIGCNSDDESYFPDCRKLFLDAMNSVIEAAGYHIKVKAPFLNWSKARIAAHAQEIGVKCEMIWTCYKGGKEPCGMCPACIKLNEALKF